MSLFNETTKTPIKETFLSSTIQQNGLAVCLFHSVKKRFEIKQPSFEIRSLIRRLNRYLIKALLFESKAK